jgi:hypothetical protein
MSSGLFCFGTILIALDGYEVPYEGRRPRRGSRKLMPAWLSSVSIDQAGIHPIHHIALGWARHGSDFTNCTYVYQSARAKFTSPVLYVNGQSRQGPVAAPVTTDSLVLLVIISRSASL